MGQRLYKRGDSPNWYVYLGKIRGKDVYKTTGCRDKRAAEARARELEREQHAPHHPAKDAPTLAVAMGRAIADRKITYDRADDTIKMHEAKSGHLNRILGADTPLPEIEAPQVDEYVAQRMAEGASRSTIGKELSTLRITLKHARRRKEYPHQLDEVMPAEWNVGYEPRTRALSPEEMRRVLADLLDDNLPMDRATPGPARTGSSKRTPVGPVSSFERTRTRSMKDRAARVAFILATSARWGESERARPEDVDWRAGLVQLRGTKARKSWRKVPILPTTAPLLHLALKYGRDEGLLFEPWLNVRRDLRAVCRRVGIPAVSANESRRSTGRLLRDAGVEPHLIAEVLGHADSRTVEQMYGQLPPEQLRKLLLERMAKVAPLLSTGTTAKAPEHRKTGRSR
jgi:integrase